MKILVNNEIKELVIANPKSGCDYTQDLIGNAGGFDGYDDDKELHTMDVDTYEWWSNYITVEQDLENRINELRNSIDDTDKLEKDIIDAGDSDYEMMQSNLTDTVKKWEDK